MTAREIHLHLSRCASPGEDAPGYRPEPRTGPARVVRLACPALVLAWLSAVPVTAAPAPLTYVQQQRSVYAASRDNSQTINATDFGLFDRTANAGATGGGQYSAGRASQRSTLEPGRATMSGQTQAWGSSGYASSTLDVVFDVAEPTPFTLEGLGFATVGNLPEATSTIRLTGDTLTVVSWTATYEHQSLNASGMLEPGRYAIYAQFTASNAPGFSVTNGYSMTLAIPEPAGISAAAGSLLIAAATRNRGPRRRQLKHSDGGLP